MSKGLSEQEVLKIVNFYIGVSAGYLGDFSYRSHKEFYPLYCGLSINPDDYIGTTRERFIEIISSQNPSNQTKIIRGVLQRFPVDAENKPGTRTQELYADLLKMIENLESEKVIVKISLQDSYNSVIQALEDVEILLEKSNASSGIDRLFTALHGYLEFILDEASISYNADSSISYLYKTVRENHPAFQYSGTRKEDIDKITKALSTIIDVLQPIRNKASLAHPNELLQKPEAMLVVNSTRTVLQYLDNKIASWENKD